MNTIKHQADLLAAERKRKGLSPATLARESGVSRAGLYRFAKGGDIRLSTFLALCDKLDMELLLAPKAVAASVQMAANDAATGLKAGRAAPKLAPIGPQSAVAARLQKLQQAAKGQKDPKGRQGKA